MISKRQICCWLFFISCCSAWGQKNPCNPTGAPYTTLPGDTTLILKGGTQITFNRCEYFDLRDCLEFDELLDQQSIDASGLTTQDDEGNTLLSCGMLKIKLTPDCSGKTCFDVPIRVRIPFSINFSFGGKADSCASCDSRGIRLFIATGNTWSNTNTPPYKIIELEGKKYFEFYSQCGNISFNCDCCIWRATTKVKFKAKNMARLDSLIIRTACPVGVLKFTPKKKGKKIVVKMACRNQGSFIVSAKGTGTTGETIVFGPRQINQMDHGRGRKNCSSKKGKVIKRILGIFPIREGYYYKKYFIQ